jgi:trans-aconitate 2-methyltransferase
MAESTSNVPEKPVSDQENAKMLDWSPEEYLLFQEFRAAPSRDLLSRVVSATAQKIVDLGCGPGNSTRLLHQAFPGAHLYGLDSSQSMLLRAKKDLPSVTFKQVEATVWTPDKDIDLVFSNAMFQWLPDHHLQLRRIFERLCQGAFLAVQMPDNLAEPSHMAMAAVAAQSRWSQKLRGAGEQRSPLLSPSGYHNLLSPFAKRLEIWRTVYHHLMPSHRAIADMLSTTGLKPYLDLLPENDRMDFLADYVAHLKQRYPANADGTVLFAFPRLFIVASRGDKSEVR